MENTLIQKKYRASVTRAASIKDYLELCKIKVVALLVLTALVGLALAPDMGRSFILQGFSLLGIGLLASSAAVINHIVDHEIDAKMARTKNRPVVKGRVSRTQALVFSASIAVTGFVLLVYSANWLTAELTLFALVGYAFIYTLYLKRATPQNIVIGGLAGAMPPLLGWVSETNQLAAEPWLLVMIIFTWTPPHFWALAIHRREDYKKAKIPMLPVTHGVAFSKTCVLLYSLLLTLVCIVPYLIGMSGHFYLVSAMILNGIFLYKATKLKLSGNCDSAMDLFKFSIIHLMLLFIALFIDKAIIAYNIL
ncbi:heme o synthase [Pseudoalteromonas denitrificans]|uniref:Protoheme IX farnesyltransferase n=1 Tax=Pseudoalteromonas denitrificans DSM 6059 TaxID=1123010 RepID=A0A1I1RNV9_9GAMM|nr:heme o synthase [Pseudoalteromonas denitrificans]SFD36066.1 protoheme IX farnesyltransferase [Pseudoalteromonas denitrificans DSM 6059]